jgi:RNA polymerase sigma-70 factor (ECF subfamily)
LRGCLFSWPDLTIRSVGPSSVGMENPEIVAKAVAGDTDASDTLMRSSWPHAFRLAMTITKDRALAEDAAQEACFQASRDLRRLRDVGSYRQWFLRIASREAIGIMRNQQRAAQCAPEIESVEHDASAELIDLRRALMDLPSELRIPLVLSTYCGFSGKEIASLLYITPANVRFRVWRAKALLRERLGVQEQSLEGNAC